MADHYYGRLLSRAWVETKAFWSSYRWWLSLSPPIVAVLGLLGVKGWSEIKNASYVLLNAVAGTAITFFGTWLISVVRAAKLLDDERSTTVTSQAQTISFHEKTISELQDSRKPLERKKAVVVGMLKSFNEEEKEFLLWLAHSGNVLHPYIRGCNLPQPVIDGALTKGRLMQLVQDRHERNVNQSYGFINPEFKEAIVELLSQ